MLASICDTGIFLDISNSEGEKIFDGLVGISALASICDTGISLYISDSGETGFRPAL